MQSDKEIALQFLDVIESYLVQVSLLQKMLEWNVPNWQEQYQSLLQKGEVAAKAAARRSTQALRDQVLEAPDASQVAESILKQLRPPE